MLESFKDSATEDIFEGEDTKAARRRLPQTLWTAAREVLDQLNAARSLNDVRVPPSNRLKRLRGKRQGQWSLRINDQYRICFAWHEGGAHEVEITDYH